MKALLLTSFLIALVVDCVASDEPVENLVTTTTQFAFYSDFATNLNDALIVAGSARNGAAVELFSSEKSTECFDQLPGSVKAGWNLATSYYAEIISPVDWQAREQILLRLDLAHLEDSFDTRALEFTQLARNVRAAASPAYRACWWSQQDEVNRKWIRQVRRQLDHHEAAIAARLEKIYATPWHGLPLKVDVVAEAPPVGANSIYLSPVGGHILIASSIAPADALELVFHEASHTIMSPRRKDPVAVALESAATESGVKIPADLWHVVLFYLTGEVVKIRLRQSGNGNYVSYVYAHNLWKGSWSVYKEAIEATLPAYLSGETPLSQAADNLVRALQR